MIFHKRIHTYRDTYIYILFLLQWRWYRLQREPWGRREERWIKHYSSAHNILLVGEGDFSFSLCLAMAFGSATNIIATSLDSYDELIKKYRNARENLAILGRRGASLIHGLDATQMKYFPYFQTKRFHRIIYNFPHAGFHGREDDPNIIMMHRNLIRGFFMNASSMLWLDGEIHVNHKITAPFSNWKIEELALQCSLVLTEPDDFKIEHYPGYKNKRGSGSRCDEPFYLGECRTFKFKLCPATTNIVKMMQSNLVFIGDVTPSTPTWSVKVRVEKKMQPRQSTKSPTKYQKIILADEKGSKMVATLYQPDINALGKMLLVHNTYIISRARVDPIEEKYRIIDNPYQWIINSKTAILQVNDGFAASSDNVLPFTRLSELPSLIGSKSLIDVVVVVIDKMPQRTIVWRGRTILVQDLGVIDSELKPYALTLWSDLAEDFGTKLKVDSHNMPVVKFTRFIVNTYYGISLGSTVLSDAIIDPPIPEAAKLTAWKRKNVAVLREFAATRSYISRSGTSAPANSIQSMDISSLLDSTELGKMRVEAYAKITDMEQRCFYVACDKCASSSIAEVGWEFECSRCQELCVAIPRAKVSIVLYDKDADIDAFAFSEIAEKLLKRSAADCMNDHRMGLNGFLHFANEQLNEKVCVFTVRKKRVLRKNGEEDQYVITDIVHENDDMTAIDTTNLVPDKDDKGKAVAFNQLSPLHDSVEGSKSPLPTGPAHAGNLISEESKLSYGPAATQSHNPMLISSSKTATKLFDNVKLVDKDEVPPCLSSTAASASTEEPIPCDLDVDDTPLAEKGPRKLLLPADSDDEHVPIIRSSKRKRT